MKKQENPIQTVFIKSMLDYENVDENNSESWKRIERLFQSGDDRSKTILAGIIVEYHLDRLLKLLFIDYKHMSSRSDYTFSFKISILKSLRLIPIEIITMCDCIRKARNEFAHNLEINDFSEIKENIKKQIHQLYSENAEKNDKYDLIKKFTGLFNLSTGGLRSYEQNIRILRERMDDSDFILELHKTNENRMYKYHEDLISNEPIRVENHGKNQIEEIYPNGLGIIKNKNNR